MAIALGSADESGRMCRSVLDGDVERTVSEGRFSVTRRSMPMAPDAVAVCPHVDLALQRLPLILSLLVRLAIECATRLVDHPIPIVGAFLDVATGFVELLPGLHDVVVDLMTGSV